MKWNNEQLSEAVKTSTSYRQVLKKLGLTGAGGNYDNIPRKVKELNLDVKHFTGKVWNKGRVFAPVRPVSD